MYTIQNQRVFGLCPSSEILNTRKHEVSESVSISLHLTTETVPVSKTLGFLGFQIQDYGQVQKSEDATYFLW
jgi:hypothetical protein